MAQLLLIGIGAGFAAALLFASPIGGTSLAFPLFCLTGVPIAIAGLGWTPMAAFIAGLSGAVALAALLSPLSAFAFLLMFGVPVVWCVRLACLSRTTADGEEWYPIGRILLHATGLVAAGIVGIGVLIGYQSETMTANMTQALETWFESQPEIDQRPTPEEIEPFVRFNLLFLPYVLGAIALIVVVFDLWLGSVVTRMSGRLRRPREAIWTAVLPAEAAPAMLLAFGLSFLPAPFGEIAAVFAGALACAYALLGLAVLHAVTIGHRSRRAILVATYFLLVFFGFPFLVFIVVGLGETFFHLRARRFHGAPPPTT